MNPIGWLRGGIQRQLLAVLVVLVALVALNLAQVYSYISEQKADARIVNIASRQRMLAERLAREALAVSSADEASRESLTETLAEFDATLNDLQQGNRARGIPSPPGDVGSQLDKVRAIWVPLQQQARAVQTLEARNAEFTSALDYVIQHNGELLAEMDTAVGLYATDDRVPGEVVDISGRQRMLSQRLVQEALALASGDEASRAALAATAAEFDGALSALLDGSAERGIPAASGAVRQQLLTVQEVWTPLHEQVQTIQTAPVENLEFVAALEAVRDTSALLVIESDAAVRLYEEAFSGKISTLRQMLIALGVAALVVAAGIWWFIGHFIVSPIVHVRDALTEVARGDVTRTVAISSRDEIGDMARSYDRMRTYLTNLADAADTIAGGALEAEVEPQSENDRLGKSFAAMISSVSRAQGALRESEERFRTVFETSKNGLVVFDEGGHAELFNSALCEMVGYTQEEMSSMPLPDVLLPEDIGGVYAAIAAQAAAVRGATLTLRLIRKDGRVIQTEVSSSQLILEGVTIRVLAEVRDVTEERRLREQLLVAQKSEALSTLVAGVAHDFNNLLTSIGGSIDLARREPRDSKWLKNASLATDRATNLVRQLVQFARRDAPNREPMALADAVENAALLARETFDRRISFEVNVAEGLPAVLADANQMEQVMMNLLVNARDAVGARLSGEPPSSGYAPRITITVDECDPSACGIGAERCLRIAVRDNGTGMSPAVRQSIFDPFFTTKARGEGTGLGLSIAYDIIAEHEGIMNVVTELGEGTAFTLELPAAVAGSESADAIGTERALFHDDGTRGSVLVVEDEPELLAFAETALADAGFEIVAVSNGDEALSVIAERFFDLAVVDISMPAPDGWDVLAGIQDLTPETKVLMTSGHAAEREVLERGAAGFLAKPYRLSTLLRAVQESIGEMGTDAV